MKSYLKSFLIGAALCSVAASSAFAEIFVLENQRERFSVSFPDTWQYVSNQKPDDKATVAGPGAYQFSSCRVRVREDRRFVIYPHKFYSSIQKTAISRDFWDDYLGEYNDAKIDAFRDEAGLGPGHASMVEVSFETSDATVVRKRGIMFASLQQDRLYIVDCSSEESVYADWRPAFLGIIKSVDFDKAHANSNGYYRDFNNEPKVEVLGPRELDGHKL